MLAVRLPELSVHGSSVLPEFASLRRLSCFVVVVFSSSILLLLLVIDRVHKVSIQGA